MRFTRSRLSACHCHSMFFVVSTHVSNLRARVCKYVYYLFHSTILRMPRTFSRTLFHWAETMNATQSDAHTHNRSFLISMCWCSLLFHLSKHFKTIHTQYFASFQFHFRRAMRFRFDSKFVPAQIATGHFPFDIFRLCCRTRCICVYVRVFVKDILLFWPFHFKCYHRAQFCVLQMERSFDVFIHCGKCAPQ